MARLSFTQGIVRHGKTPGQQFFLQQNDVYVDLVVSPDSTIIAFADGNKDYLFTESVTIIKAWGPLSGISVPFWLYWDINRVTGIRTFGYTTLEPVVGNDAPSTPQAGQMWFNTSEMKMYEYNGSNWVQVLRVFAAKYYNGQFLSPVDGVSVESNFTGSQVGSVGNVTKDIGSLVFDKDGKPIVNQDGKFFTTEDIFTAGVPTGASLKVNNILVRAQAQENISSYQVVVFNEYNKIGLAKPFDYLDKIYGIVEEDVYRFDVANVITEGVIFNELWDFTDTVNNPSMSGNINDPLYVTSTGELTTDIGLSVPGSVPVGAIIDKQSILFKPGLYGAGLGGVNLLSHGELSGLLDDDHPQYLTEARGDNRYYTQTVANSIFAPLSHTHTKSDITDFAHTHVEADITDLDKYTQAEVDLLLGGRVSRAGDTMTGELILYGDPVNDLGAATKQYVDAVAAGLDAKDSVAVATVSDIGGTYNPNGGTGATGQFTGVDVTALDGILGTDYDFNITTRVLIKDQIDARQNGIYVVTNYTDPSNATLERAPDHDGNPTSEVSPGNYTFVAGGLTQSGTGWVILAGTATGPNDTIILNTDEIYWSQVSSATAYSADGLTINIDPSNVISVIPASSGGQVDALLWNGHNINATPTQDNEVLLFNSATSEWVNGFLPFIRNADNSSNVTINTTTNDINIDSATTLSLNTTTGNINVQSSQAVNVSSVGNTALTSSSGNIILAAGSAGNFTISSANNISVVGNELRLQHPSTGGATISLVSLPSTNAISLKAPDTLGSNILFVLPNTTGNPGDVLSTDGAGNTSWIAPPSGGGGGSQFCIRDTDGDTFVEVGFGASPSCTDGGTNDIQIQAGNGVYGGGNINLVGGSASTGGNINITSGTGTSGVDGNIYISTPHVSETSPSSGAGSITLRSGNGALVPAGNVSVYGGDSAESAAGSIKIAAGGITTAYGPPGPYATAGNVIISGGAGYNDFAGGIPSADVYIRTRESSAKSGNIELTPGAFSGSIELPGGGGVDGQGAVLIRKYAAGPVTSAYAPEIRLYDGSSSDPNYVSLKAPDNLFGAGLNVTLPNVSTIVPGRVLTINGTYVPPGAIPGVTYITTEFRDVPYDVSAQGFGTLIDGDILLRFTSPRSFLIFTTGHQGYAETAPTADATFDISFKSNASSAPTSIGTITFLAGSQTASFNIAAEQSVFAGGIIIISCTTANNIADVSITLNAVIR